jgi:ABC-type sugar transport system permease subunit
MRIFFNSFFWTLTCTALHVILGVALAVLLNRKFPGRTLARSLLILPWAVPSFVSTLMWRAYVFDDDKGFLGDLAKTFPDTFVFTTSHMLSIVIGISIGIILVILLIRAINKVFRIPPILKSLINFGIIVAGFYVGGVIVSLLMRSLGTVNVGLFGYKIIDIPQIVDTFWITDSIYIMGLEFKMITFSAILINVWLGVPFMMLSFLATLQSIPKDLYEAAEIDGLSSWDQFKRITMPLLKPTLLTVSLLGIIWTFNLFNVVYILSQNQNGLGDATNYDIFVTFIFERFSRAQPQYSQAAALSITVFLILISFSLVYRRLIQAEKIWEGEEK